MRDIPTEASEASVWHATATFVIAELAGIEGFGIYRAGADDFVTATTPSLDELFDTGDPWLLYRHLAGPAGEALQRAGVIPETWAALDAATDLPASKADLDYVRNTDPSLLARAARVLAMLLSEDVLAPLAPAMRQAVSSIPLGTTVSLTKGEDCRAELRRHVRGHFALGRLEALRTQIAEADTLKQLDSIYAQVENLRGSVAAR